MKKKLIVILLCSQLAVCLKAQYIFSNLYRQDGLSSNRINCIYKDRQGFIWAGATNGLNRYDGSVFKVFNKANKNFVNINDEEVSTITEYGNGKIWFGTKEGLFYYDKQTATFENIKIFDEFYQQHKNLSIFSLLVDGNNHLLIGTSQGLFIYDNDKCIPAYCIFPGAEVFLNKTCLNLLNDPTTNSFWAGTSKGLVLADFKTGLVQSYKNNPNQLTLFDSNSVQALAVDCSGNIWWSDPTHPLAFYNSASNAIESFRTFGNNPEWKIVPYTCNKFFIDHNNRLWISTYYYKIFVREPDGTFIMLPNHSPENYLPSSGYFTDMCVDNENTIWIATINGISKLKDRNYLKNVIRVKAKNPHDITDVTLLNCFLKTDQSNWWIGKDDGLYNFNLNQIKEFRPDPKSQATMANRIFDIILLNNELWCATGDGVKIFNLITKKFRSLRYHPDVPRNKNKAVIWLYKDDEGFIWIPFWVDALCRYNPKTEEIIKFDGSNPNYGDMGPANSICLLEIDNRYIWVNRGIQGIRIFDKKKNIFTNFRDSLTKTIMNNATVYNMIMDNERNIWAAIAYRGIYKFTMNGVLIDSVNTNNGFNTVLVNNLALDSTGLIWASSPEGLNYFNPKDKMVFSVNTNLTMPSGDGWNVIKIQNDSLVVTNMDRLVIIDLKNVEIKLAQQKPLITSISVFEKEIPYCCDQVPLRLGNTENFFSITFSSIHHTEDPTLKYAYKLEGFDKNWIHPDRRQVASYTNVPDGDYQFKVKCIGPNGIESEENIIPIHIQAPIWKQWWVLILSLVIFGSMLYWLIQLRNRNHRKKEINNTIDYFVNSVYGENSVNEICWDIARNCISKLHFEDCVVYLFDESSNRFIQRSAYGPKNPKEHEIVNQMEIEIGKGIVGTVAATGKALLINDTSIDNRYIVDDEMRFSELTVPILHDGKVIGIIDSEHSKKNFFTVDHLKAVNSIASISSNKIAEAQAEAYAKENEIKLLEINKLLAESQLMALRAQMNPHFVFNCLNSIQECIVTQKYGEASNYLNKFSKLFRTVLNNSGKNLVSINDEKEVLELYLVLEHMRFDKSFSFSITIDEDLEADEILIPSMLIQPYVENALWHGLMHKEGERILKIEFIKLNENTYRCIIDDNGIGRNKSFELKEQQSKAKRHESKGLKISKDRLDVLNKQGYHTKLEIIDKPDDGGTTVKIELSTYLNY